MLPAFLASLGRRTWRWGETDCTLILADWVRAVRGVDPASHLRGAYSTEAECGALLRRGGGLRAVIAACVAPLGIAETSTPARGDIGLVKVPFVAGNRVARMAVGGVALGAGRWAIFTKDGPMIVQRVRVVAAWSV